MFGDGWKSSEAGVLGSWGLARAGAGARPGSEQALNVMLNGLEFTL